jgi:hypothetical protein
MFNYFLFNLLIFILWSGGSCSGTGLQQKKNGQSEGEILFYFKKIYFYVYFTELLMHYVN